MALQLGLVNALSEYHQRELISVPVVKRHGHPSVAQRCGLRAATIELDTAAHPSIEYVAGTRLNVYPPNGDSQVQLLCDFLVDDLKTILLSSSQIDSNYNSPFWVKFIQTNRDNSLRLALTYFLDLSNFPSRELLRYIGERCTQRAQRLRMESIVNNNDSWERFVCQDRRTVCSVLEEFNSCRGRLSAKRMIIHELLLGQQARQYSLSNIKSSKRFRAEIIVFQHQFTAKQIALNLNTIREHECELAQQTGAPPRSPAGQPFQLQQQQQQAQKAPKSAYRSPAPQSQSTARPRAQSAAQLQARERTRASSSLRSLRSVAVFSSSPISTQQVRRLPLYSGPLMSLYAASSTGLSSTVSSSAATPLAQAAAAALGSKSLKTVQTINSLGTQASVGQQQQQQQLAPMPRRSLLTLPEMVSKVHSECQQQEEDSKLPKASRFEGLCSNYLLNLQPGDQVLCEFVENPRFTLKGNRERPIMMIAQDVGLIAFRPFWQQRHLEHDRAQVFYTLFKDLAPKKFGDMHLVCLTGNKCKVEDLFKREISSALASKILTSANYVGRQQLVALLDAATKRGHHQASASAPTTPSSSPTNTASTLPPASNTGASHHRGPHLPINSKELLDLGLRIYKLLVENNGCLYTCCDPHMTQALEILTVECILRYNKFNWTYEHIVSMLPKWKGRKEQNEDTSAPVFQLENTFERAHIVQEIYDSTI